MARGYSDDLRVRVIGFLSHYYEGFENNDGGFGKVVIDVAAGKIRLEHNWRITSYEYTEAEL